MKKLLGDESTHMFLIGCADTLHVWIRKQRSKLALASYVVVSITAKDCMMICLVFATNSSIVDKPL